MFKATSILLAACLFLFTAVLAAQTITSSLLGTVNDASASSVPGAEVQLVNESTNTVLTAKTNVDGMFRFPTLLAGFLARYKSRAAQPQTSALPEAAPNR